MKLKVPQPRQRHPGGAGSDIDLRDDAREYDTEEHDVYVGTEDEEANPERPFDDSNPSGAEFSGTQTTGGDGSRGYQPVRSGRPRFDIRNTWQVIAGSILIPVGVAAIILAWYGAAHARVDQQQIPYMVSGGFLGLGAIVAGALMYWAHWLYRIYDQADLHHHQLMRSQAELRDAILSTKGDGTGRNLNGSVPVPAEARGAKSAFVATASGTNFHRADCPIVARRPAGLREVSGRDVDRLQPCRICDPLAGQV